MSKRDGSSQTNLSVHEENGQLLSISLHYEGLESVGVEPLFQREGEIKQNKGKPRQGRCKRDLRRDMDAAGVSRHPPSPRESGTCARCNALNLQCTAVKVRYRVKCRFTIWSRRKDLPVRMAPATERTQAGRSATLGSQKTSLTSKLAKK